MTPNSLLLAGALTDAEQRVFHETFSDAVTNTPSGAVRYALVWKPPLGIYNQLPNLEVVFSLGAGVDHVLRDPDMPDVPLVRFVDPDLTGRMVEWVVLQCLMHLRRQRHFDGLQQQRRWEQQPTPIAHEVTVGVMGLGTLGSACAEALRGFGFRLRGLSRTRRQIDGIEMFSADDKDAFLAGTDILVNLMPLTEQTRGLINASLIGGLKRGGPLGAPVIINAGRGGSQIEADIAAALADGRLAGVSLDVFEAEPLAAESPLWSFDNAILTPHVAAATNPVALAAHVSAQIGRHEAGLDLQHVVDRNQGY